MGPAALRYQWKLYEDHVHHDHGRNPGPILSEALYPIIASSILDISAIPIFRLRWNRLGPVELSLDHCRFIRILRTSCGGILE